MSILRWLCLSTYVLAGLGELIFILALVQASGVALLLPLGLPIVFLSLLAAFFAYRGKTKSGLLVSFTLLACPAILMRQHLMLLEDAFWLIPAPAVGLVYFGLRLGLKPSQNPT